MSRTVTRSEFYNLVWSTPIRHLAKEFQVSDSALHAICKRHDIPKPPAGFWMKKEVGRAPEPTPLPPAAAGKPDRITISAVASQREPKPVADAREKAVAIASAEDTGDVATHPIVERTLARLRKAKPVGVGTVSTGAQGLIKADVGVESIDRLGTILNRLVAAAEAQGFQLKATDSSAHLDNGTDTIAFSVTELTDREKHHRTEAEEAREAAWAARRDRAMKIDPWRTLEYERPKFPEWDYHLTGRLSIELERVYSWGTDSLRRSFRDGKIQRLEKVINDIAVAIAVLAGAKVAERERRAAEEKRMEEDRRLRDLAKRAEHIEKRRAEALATILSEVQDIEQLRAQLNVLERDVAADPSPRVQTFLDWTRNRLALQEASLIVSSLEQRFEKEKLFGDTDDYNYYGSWYR